MAGPHVVISFPDKPTGLVRFDWDDVAVYFAPFAEFRGFGTSPDGMIYVNLDIPEGEDVKSWAARMCDALTEAGAPIDTYMAIFPTWGLHFMDEEWWRVDVLGPRGTNGPLMMRVRNDYDAPDGLIELGYVSD